MTKLPWTVSTQRLQTTDGRELVIVIPMRTHSETNMREPWQARHRRRKSQRHIVGLSVRAPFYRDAISVPCDVVLTRIAPHALDDDNLVSSFKATRDSIAEVLRIDDRDPRVTWRYAQRRGKPRQYAVEIRVRKGEGPH